MRTLIVLALVLCTSGATAAPKKKPKPVQPTINSLVCTFEFTRGRNIITALPSCGLTDSWRNCVRRKYI